MSFIDCFNSIFGIRSQPTVPPEDPMPVMVPPRIYEPHIHLSEAIQTAITITSRFEGNSGFGNVVGNFDGQGLTCGALGFAWGQGVHQKIVLEGAKVSGLLKSKMPKYGDKYYSFAALGIPESLPLVSQWSDSSSGKVFPALYSELRTFWSCPEVVDLQVKHALDIGQRAYRDASYWSQQYRRLVSPTLHEFVFFFDVIVQNGSLGIKYSDLEAKMADPAKALEEVIAWAHWYEICDNDYLSKKDAGANSRLWETMKSTVEEEQKYLLLMGYLRANKSAARYQGNVLNRKGTIAMGCGYVNKTLYSLEVEYPQLMKQIVL